MNRKKKRKFCSVLLSAVMVLSLFGGQIWETKESRAAEYGVANPVIKDGVTTWDTIYFGNYYQSDADTKEPIRWRVLSVEGDDAFLLADKCLDCKPYNENREDVTWETCTLRSWLNDEFYREAFSSEEQAAIQETTVENNNNLIYETEGGRDTEDKVYLLSMEEAINVKYGFSKYIYKFAATRQAEATTYAKYRGASTDGIEGNANWWCRSVGFTSSDRAMRGATLNDDNYVDTTDQAVRPVLHLNLSDTSLWSKGEKVSAEGAEDEETTDSAPEATANPAYGLDSPVIEDGVTTWDTIYFGNYYQNYYYNTKEPIRWRVLSVNGDDAFLLADKCLDCKPYNENSEDVTWETCTLRSWLNDDFYQKAFSSEEQAAIQETTVKNYNNPYSGNNGGKDTKDKVYLLSLEEIINTKYGFSKYIYKETEARQAEATTYAKYKGARTEGNTEWVYWWCRSVGCFSNSVSCVGATGWGNRVGTNLDQDGYAVRPALHLNLSSTSLWRKGEKVSVSDATAKPDTSQEPNATSEPEKYGITNPVIKKGVTTWDTIYFGNYYQSDANTKEPIRWRVLSVDGDDAFLMADKCLDCQPYNKDNESVTWETCTLRNWLNDEFYREAFSSEEQAAVQRTTVENHDNPHYGTEGGRDTEDKVYLPSLEDITNTKYGFSKYINKETETRWAEVTEYAAESQGAGKVSYTDKEVSRAWWCRSAGANSNVALWVNHTGCGSGGSIVSFYYAVRPVLHLNLSSVSLWSKGEKVSEDGADEETADVSEAVPEATANPAYGLDSPVTRNDVTTWDTIYFGNYYQSDAGTKEPIRWRVLSVNGDDAFLLADKCLDCQPYHETRADVTWEICTLRNWLNDIFYQEAFSSEEREAIQKTTVKNHNNPYYGTKGGKDVTDKVFLLSLEEIVNIKYGFSKYIKAETKTRQAEISAYAKSKGAETDMNTGMAYWWCRSAGCGSSSASLVCFDGGSLCDSPYGTGSAYESIYEQYIAVRPALHLNLSNVSLWRKGEKVSAGGADEETEQPEVSQTPEVTEQPEVSQAPEATEEPEVSQTPEATEEPEVSQAPIETEQPEASQAPTETEQPEASQPPKATEKPEASQPPKATEKPEVSQPPKATEKPEVSQPPKATEKPEVSQPPKETAKPEASQPPTVTPTQEPNPSDTPALIPENKPNQAEEGAKLVTKSGKTYIMIDGKIQKGKTQIVAVNKKTYIINKKGVVIKGKKNKLVKVGKKYYIVNKKGVVYKNKKRVKVGKKYYKINKKGVAKLIKKKSKK